MPTVTRAQIKAVENRMRRRKKPPRVIHKGLLGLGQACYDPQSGEAVDCSSTWGTTYTTDDGDSSFWDNFFKLIQIGSTAAVNIIKADNQYYYTPQGAYRYGTGQYRAVTPSQALMYVQQRPGGVSAGGGITLDWQTLMMLGMGAMLLFTFMRR